MIKFVLILLFSQLSYANNFAKEAASSVKLKEVPVKQQKIPEMKSSSGLNNIICPKVSEQFINSANSSLRSIEDLYQTYLEQRNKSEEFFITIIELDKRKIEHESAVGKIMDIKKGIDQKLTRAKDNYNNELKSLANLIKKQQQCWGFTPKDKKEEVSKLLALFKTKNILNEFKSCVSILERNNSQFNQQYTLSLNFFNKIISDQTLMKDTENLQKKISGNMLYENKQCEPFSQKGKYASYIKDQKPVINENDILGSLK